LSGKEMVRRKERVELRRNVEGDCRIALPFEAKRAQAGCAERRGRSLRGGKDAGRRSRMKVNAVTEIMGVRS